MPTVNETYQQLVENLTKLLETMTKIEQLTVVHRFAHHVNRLEEMLIDETEH